MKLYKNSISIITMSLNKDFSRVMQEMYELRMKSKDSTAQFRAKVYKQAIQSINTCNIQITHPDQLKSIGIKSDKVISKLTEYFETGSISELEKEKAKPISNIDKVYQQFINIHGIGPKKAQKLIDSGITSIETLREESINDEKLLTKAQNIGLDNFEDFQKKIPRKEIDVFKNILEKCFEKHVENKLTSQSTFEIVGSYRRMKNESGDIDIIITNKENDDNAYKLFIKCLINKGLLTDTLSNGKTKSMFAGRIPKEFSQFIDGEICSRRIDIMYSPPEEYPFAILYFTGSKEINTIMRQKALDIGLTLNEQGLSIMKNGVKGEFIDKIFNSEEEIFDYLKIKYLEPHERIDTVEHL